MTRYTFRKEKGTGVFLNTGNAFLFSYYARLTDVALVR